MSLIYTTLLSIVPVAEEACARLDAAVRRALGGLSLRDLAAGPGASGR